MLAAELVSRLSCRPARNARAREPGVAAGQRDSAASVGIFCDGGATPPVEAIIAFIDEHRAVHGGEPICRLLPIAHQPITRAPDAGNGPGGRDPGHAGPHYVGQGCFGVGSSTSNTTHWDASAHSAARHSSGASLSAE